MSIDEVFDWRMGDRLTGNVSTKVIGVGKVVGKGEKERDFLSMPSPTVTDQAQRNSRDTDPLAS